MKRIAILLTLLTVLVNFSFGQTTSDSISMVKVFGGYKFYQGDQRLTQGQLNKVLKTNDEAYKQIKSAQASYISAMILSYSGGALIGWPIGAALAGGDPQWIMAGIGAGLIVASIPLSNHYYKKVKRAVEIYNDSLVD